MENLYASPKSAKDILLFETKILFGLISLCIIYLEWSYSNPDIILYKIDLITLRSNLYSL